MNWIEILTMFNMNLLKHELNGGKLCLALMK